MGERERLARLAVMGERWREQLVKQAQPQTAVVANVEDSADGIPLVWINVIEDEDMDSARLGLTQREAIRYTGSAELHRGDIISVSRPRGPMGRQILSYEHNSTDGTGYPRVRTDKLVVATAGGAIDIDAGDLTLGGNSLKNDGIVAVSASDGTWGYLIDQLWADEGITFSKWTAIGGNELVWFKLDIGGMTAETAPDAANDYVAIYDASAGEHRKTLIQDLPASDPSAIHDDVAGEIAALTEKASPASADKLLIEDSAGGNAKKYVQVGNLPSGSGSALEQYPPNLLINSNFQLYRTSGGQVPAYWDSVTGSTGRAGTFGYPGYAKSYDGNYGLIWADETVDVQMYQRVDLRTGRYSSSPFGNGLEYNDLHFGAWVRADWFGITPRNMFRMFIDNGVTQVYSSYITDDTQWSFVTIGPLRIDISTEYKVGFQADAWNDPNANTPELHFDLCILTPDDLITNGPYWVPHAQDHNYRLHLPAFVETPPAPPPDTLLVYGHRYGGLYSMYEDGAEIGYGGSLFVQTADATVANTTTETTLIASGEGTTTLPANLLKAGRRLRITASGHISDTGAPTLNVRVKLGGTTICATGAVTLNNTVTQTDWHMTVDITCRSAGATGTVQGGGIFDHDNGGSFGMVNTSAVTVDTTGTLAVDVTGEWGTADAADTITCQQLAIEVLN